MAYSEYLADRIRQSLERKNIAYEEKRMFGGMAIMVNEKMCVGVIGESLMARLDPDFEEEALSMPGCRPMDFTGRPMKGYVYVEGEGLGMDEDLDRWIGYALEYNPKARSSKKK